MKSFLIICITLFSAATTTIAEEDLPSYHRSFNGRELAETFGVNHHDNVPKYVSTKVHGLQMLQDNVENSFSLKAFGKDLNIKVLPNKDFVAETHTTEFVDEHGNSTKYYGVLGVFSFGVVVDEPNSHVALHHSGNGIRGSIRISNDLYIINPLPHRLKNDQDNHVVFRASDVPGDHIMKKPFNADEDLVNNINVHRRSRRSTRNLPKKTIELLIAGDYKMLEFYGEDVLPSYMLAVANVMAGFYRDASLAYPLDLVVVRTAVFKTDILQAKNVDDLLHKFSGWCNKNNNADENSEDHFDAALLFSRNGCKDGCAIEGLAFSDVTCNMRYSQGVGKDRGFLTAMTLSHELGHVLNGNHDGRDGCPDGLNIMASGGVSGGPQAFRWSKCTSKTLEATLKSPRSSCFDDTPPKKKTDSKFQLYGTIFDANKQCAYMFGKRYQKCSQLQRRCDVLYCNPKGTMVCETLFFPSLHGTYCEKYKWCIDGACVPDGSRPPKPIHGGWSSWSEYTACNKPCNIGIQWRIRHCNNPAPSYGGSSCNKKSPEIGHNRACNTQNCKGTTYIKDRYRPDRHEQCNALNKGTSYCIHCRGTEPCSLYCGGPTYGVLEGAAKSGTYCKTNDFQSGVCVHGGCVEIGCDNQLDSGQMKDRCGICNGDGSSCSPVKGSSHIPYKSHGKRGTFFVTTIPIHATAIRVQERGRTPNFLTCKIGTSNNLAIPFFSREKTVYMNGAVIRYKMTAFPNQDLIVIDGVLKVPVHIYYSNYYYYDYSKGIHWSYTIVGLNPNSQGVEVKWVADSWSACSKSCAGGTKTRTVYCRRKDDHTPASVALCNALNETKPIIKTECKPENCPAIWYTSNWSGCSLSCATGQRIRSITCAELTKAGSYQTVENSKCKKAKPTHKTVEKCNDISCPAHWEILTSYTPCSKSCEGGTSTRNVGCRRLARNSVLTVVIELECIGINKTVQPETSKICNKDVPCPRWKVEYSKCSVTCGAGVQRPNIVCSAGGTLKAVLPFEKCPQSTKPVTSSLTLKDCNLGVCNGYKWGIKETVCSTTCEEGVITSTVYCMDIVTMREFEYFRCPALTKPTAPAPKSCNAGLCPEVYLWKNDKYGQCSKSCGGGVRPSVPYCVQQKDNSTVSNMVCDAGTRPAILTRSCSINACPLHDWEISYSDCSITCGKGVEKGKAVCKKISDGTFVNNSMCNSSTKPSDTQRDCQLAVCPDPSLFNWKVMSLGCNVTCGGGVIIKEVVCYRKDSEVKFTKVSSHHCADKPQPPMNTEVCSLAACPPTHQWNKMTQYCAIGCGKGYDIIEINCTKIKTNEIADRKFCAGLATPVPQCKRNCKPVPSKVSPAIYPIGCFADRSTNPRNVPRLYGSYRTEYKSSDPIPTIEKCYQGARLENVLFFALQFYGECWIGGNSTLKTYDASGESNGCSSGTGGEFANYVYHIGSPLATINIYPVVKFGCLIVSDKSTTSNKASNELSHARIVPICGSIAYEKNQDYFGGDNEGKCLTKQTAETTMASISFSSACFTETEGMIQYHIYGFVKN